MMTETTEMTDSQTTEIEAATFRRLLDHLDNNKDVQNIDLMILANFCRNCISKWYASEAQQRGVDIDYEQARKRCLRNALRQMERSVPEASQCRAISRYGKAQKIDFRSEKSYFSDLYTSLVITTKCNNADTANTSRLNHLS